MDDQLTALTNNNTKVCPPLPPFFLPPSPPPPSPSLPSPLLPQPSSHNTLSIPPPPPPPSPHSSSPLSSQLKEEVESLQTEVTSRDQALLSAQALNTEQQRRHSQQLQDAAALSQMTEEMEQLKSQLKSVSLATVLWAPVERLFLT